MSYWLPGIEIPIDSDPVEFLDGMVRLGEASGCFDAERVHNALGVAGYEAATFDPQEECIHRGLRFALLFDPEKPKAIRVELVAERWSRDPATYDAYLAAARSLVAPVLAEWGKAHSKRYRLRIERHKKEGPKLTERTLELVERFALLANTSSLHPLDWNRFYLLVHHGRQKIPEHELRARLIDKGFSEQKADRLAELYGHLWAFKQLP
jgi:hypothetical protein